MLYITGDTHGERERFMPVSFPDESALTGDDYLIVCGDFGFLFKNDESENLFLDELEKSRTQFASATAITKISRRYFHMNASCGTADTYTVSERMSFTLCAVRCSR